MVVPATTVGGTSVKSPVHGTTECSARGGKACTDGATRMSLTHLKHRVSVSRMHPNRFVVLAATSSCGLLMSIGIIATQRLVCGGVELV